MPVSRRNGASHMNKFILTCESTSDMPVDFFAQREIPFVCFHYIMDGVEYTDDLGQSMPFDVFYKRIEQGAMPTTSQVSVGQYLDFFEPLLQKGQDILHVSLSSALSGSYQSACTARDSLLQKYPDRALYVVDSLGASSGYGLLMDNLADRRDEGYSADEAFAWAEKNKLRIHHWFFSTDLRHYKRGGRISATAALVGTLLGICPLLNMSHDGKLTPRAKARGKQRAITEISGKMNAHVQDGADYAGKCFISHSACYEDARSLADIIESRFARLRGKVLINSVGAVIGSHTGPGTVALFFFGDLRTT